VQETPGSVNLADASDTLSQNQTDIVTAIFATPDRLKTMRFLNTPIRIGVAQITATGATAEPYLPIVCEREVGYVYARYIQKMNPDRMQLVPYNANAFAQAYLNALNSSPPRRPIVYVDDVMALEVAAEILERLGNEANDQRAVDDRLPKIELDTGEAGSLGSRRPHYYLGMAVYREDAKWHEFLNEAWDIFVRSNYDYIATLYKQLHEDLNGHRLRAQERLKNTQSSDHSFVTCVNDFLEKWEEAIKRWLRHDLEGDERRILPYPWNKVIEADKNAISDEGETP
jgi:hypothetical protein